MKISEKIYRLRKESGLSQKEFAEKTSTSQAAINYWENGKRQPRIEHLKKIADAFDIPLYQLADDTYTLYFSSGSGEHSPQKARFIGDIQMVTAPIFTVPMSTTPENDSIRSKVLEEKAGEIFSLYSKVLNKAGKQKVSEEIYSMIERIEDISKKPEYQK
jgi:transcriptional regulator with XRE-family HTH domain